MSPLGGILSRLRVTEPAERADIEAGAARAPWTSSWQGGLDAMQAGMEPGGLIAEVTSQEGSMGCEDDMRVSLHQQQNAPVQSMTRAASVPAHRITGSSTTSMADSATSALKPGATAAIDVVAPPFSQPPAKEVSQPSWAGNPGLPSLSDISDTKRPTVLPPIVQLDISMRSMPDIDSCKQTFTLPRDFSIRARLFVQSSDACKRDSIVTRTFATDTQDEGPRTCDEPLKLRRFPLDVQRLHVEHTFDFCCEEDDVRGTPIKIADTLLRGLLDGSVDATAAKHAQDGAGPDIKPNPVDAKEVRDACSGFFPADAFVTSEPFAIQDASSHEWELERKTVELYYRWSRRKLDVAAVIVVRRRPLFFLINIMVPVTCIVTFAFLSFKFSPDDLNLRLQVTLTMVLTLVAFKLSVSGANYLPRLGYLTLMDFYMFCGFVLVSLVVLQNYVVFLTWTDVPSLDEVLGWTLVGTWAAINVIALVYAAWAWWSGDAGMRNKDALERYNTEHGWRKACHLHALRGMSQKALLAEFQDKNAAVRSAAAIRLAGRQDDDALRRMILGMQQAEGSKVICAIAEDNLAKTLWSRGQYEEAAQLQHRVLEGRKEALGVDHPDTFKAAGNLANTLRSRDQDLYTRTTERVERHERFKDSEQLQRHVLAGLEKVLGREHLDTLTAASNLAATLSSQGCYEEAEKLQRYALDGREEVLGHDHPDTLKTACNLAATLSSKGCYEDAEKLQRRVLEGRERVLGRDHPDTLNAMGIHAKTLWAQGRSDSAGELQRRVLDGREKVLGRNHPDTLTAANHLAAMLGSQGRYVDAEKLQRHVLESSEKVHGHDHPKTQKAVETLVDILKSQRRYHEADKFEGCLQEVRATDPATAPTDAPRERPGRLLRLLGISRRIRVPTWKEMAFTQTPEFH